ncbi:hypothetical protein Q0590_19750 [Rhodocytophaga aerolata]|uniref:Uncharacterized protein n=1 Tax=Rhodocytophaga aerolata TaxID=455078 RepID=A0ABT8R8V7_9BACT|nr:hypothetical protein [Rhodocytophaga aerolata]MDO1448521.1 hypothetical protein [Rhodocytophaga aerolata]
MKLPSLVRVPKYKRFNFEPRHYDPVKEEIKNRTERIKSELNSSENTVSTDSVNELQVKQRISEAFVRDKRRSGGKMNGLQLFLVLLLSATFVGFLYIGFPALIITGVIICLYILQQKGLLSFNFFSKASEEKEAEEDILSPASRISGHMREGRYFGRSRTVSRNGWYKMLILFATGGVALAYYIFQLNGIMSLLMIFILLILFIKESNKA